MDIYKNNTGDIQDEVDDNFYYTVLALFGLSYMCCIFNSICTRGRNPYREPFIEKTNKKIITYSEKIHTDNECSICLETFINDESLVQLKCKHIYHFHCIGDWLQRKETCPLCRRIEL